MDFSDVIALAFEKKIYVRKDNNQPKAKFSVTRKISVGPESKSRKKHEDSTFEISYEELKGLLSSIDENHKALPFLEELKKGLHALTNYNRYNETSYNTAARRAWISTVCGRNLPSP